MGFFFRKSFGLGTHGAYVAGGLKGIDYRKRLGGAAGDSSAEPELSTVALGLTLLIVGAIVVGCLGFALWIFLRT